MISIFPFTALAATPHGESAGDQEQDAARAYAHDILLVEDDAALREMLSQVLRDAGYTLHEAANGRAALKYLLEKRTRLVVTDIFMPESDGLELLTRLRTMPQRPPIIAMSGSLAGDLRVFLKIAHHLGAKHTLTKPFPLKDLLGAVQLTIGLPRKKPTDAGGQAPATGKSPTEL